MNYKLLERIILEWATRQGVCDPDGFATDVTKFAEGLAADYEDNDALSDTPKQDGTAFVITMNDGVECVVIGTQEQAETYRDLIHAKYDERQYGQHTPKDRQPFIHWAAREVPLIKYRFA